MTSRQQVAVPPAGAAAVPGAHRSGGLRKRFFAWFLAHCTARHERAIAERKRALFADLSGTVVEIGPGTGVNLKYYPRGIHWIGIEPNPFLHPAIEQAARATGVNAEWREGLADALPLDDASADAVVSTLVFCSLENVGGALGEILRVLKPGGRFIFLEHVAAEEGSSTRRWQRRAVPISSYLCDGCHPDRETWRAIESAGFSTVALDHFRLPLPLVGPHIAGVATKR